MKKVLLSLAVAAMMISCSYDDSEIWDKVNDLNDRVETLEDAVDGMNADIADIEVIIEALQNGKTIKSIDQTENGYTITFSDDSTIEIVNGKDGENGDDAPVIGIFQGEDGLYYWGVSSEGETSPLLDSDGNMIPVSGEDGTTPIMGVDANGYWTVDTGNGATQILDSEGNPIKAAGDSIFSSIEESDSCYVITLSNGETITIPKYSSFSLTIDSEASLKVVYSQTSEVAFTTVGVEGVEILSSNEEWNTEIAGDKIVVTAPAVDSENNVRILIYNAQGDCRVVMVDFTSWCGYELRTLTFEDADYVDPSINYWTSLVDTEQYNGSLLYGNEDGYFWYDDANTGLQGGMVDMDLWSGGDVISNYAVEDYAGVDYSRQLEVPFVVNGNGGNNGSANFGIHNLMSGYAPDEWNEYVPIICFADGEARTFESVYVAPNSYLLNSVLNGDGEYGMCGAYDSDDLENEYINFRVTGYDNNGMKVGSLDIKMLEESTDYVMQEWTKWDLSSLGDVWGIAFEVTGNNTGDWGFNRPAYFAFDDITVRY